MKRTIALLQANPIINTLHKEWQDASKLEQERLAWIDLQLQNHVTKSGDSVSSIRNALGRVTGSEDYNAASLLVYNRDTGSYSKPISFIMAGLSEVEADRMAPVFTFGAPIVYTGGKRPKVYSYQAFFLLNKRDGDLREAFINQYMTLMRARKLTSAGEDVYVWLSYRDRNVYGTLMNLDLGAMSSQPGYVTATFSLFVFSEH